MHIDSNACQPSLAHPSQNLKLLPSSSVIDKVTNTLPGSGTSAAARTTEFLLFFNPRQTRRGLSSPSPPQARRHCLDHRRQHWELSHLLSPQPPCHYSFLIPSCRPEPRPLMFSWCSTRFHHPLRCLHRTRSSLNYPAYLQSSHSDSPPKPSVSLGPPSASLPSPWQQRLICLLHHILSYTSLPSCLQLSENKSSQMRTLISPISSLLFLTEVICLVFPNSCRKLNEYLSIIAGLAVSYGGFHFYAYHCLFSAKCTAHVNLWNKIPYWGTMDLDIHNRVHRVVRAICCNPDHESSHCSFIEGNSTNHKTAAVKSTSAIPYHSKPTSSSAIFPPQWLPHTTNLLQIQCR